ncbi:lysoplasmalogenase-like protein TMEM86A [Callorhinchus milii]|uniref:Lysoplasmalogenase TMEM86B n=1 Tax=Callorhinchus milii TaxID=7868 RepID=A0A4W3HZ18_CALMI|nr:lysoplasmalogenase-like protein TMEM86A [Callorhinchus milii]|eukprot:gi/632977895/ref/XP_007905603.1/ PREDICTED: lysoplasmalogenase-like protein TMEM86A [Callorhinchus milii]
MRSPITLVISEPKLLAVFNVTASIYIATSSLHQIPLWLTAVTKILPILCLGFFVLAQGKKFLLSHHSLLKLLAGLVFSGLGDVLLVPSNYFIAGGVMFAIAHCFYIWMFGFKSVNLRGGSVVASATLIGATLLGTCMWRKDMATWQILALFCYCAVIGSMVWRANAEVLFHTPKPPAKVIGGLGAVCFAISDLTLALNLLCFPNIPYRTLIVMSTYYTAQLFITLSVVNDKKRHD